MEPLALTIDGREVGAPPGATLLEVARAHGAAIPTLCDDPSLGPYGGCRVCLVEEQKQGRLLASCVTPVAAGMAILTASPRVLEARREVVRLLMAGHPESCLVCDKGNRCELRRVAAELGLGATDLYRIPCRSHVGDANPFLVRDLSKCIVCARCIRADQEIVARGAIDYAGRGFDARPATLHEMPLESSDCTLCGTCLTVCPTGAIAERDPPYRGSGGRRTVTVCPLCACGCAVEMRVVEDRIVGVEPSRATSPGGAALCVRGRHGHDCLRARDRLTAPLIREAGVLVETSWERALSRAAEGLRAAGAAGTAVLAGPVLTNEEAYLLQWLARAVLGTDSIDCGVPVPPPLACPTLAEVEAADAVLVAGGDPDAEAPLLAYAVRRAVRARRTDLTVIHPVRTDLAALAGRHLRPTPGAEAALLALLVRAVEAEAALLDAEGTGAGGADPAPAESEALLRRTGVRAEELRGVARSLVTAKHPVVVAGGPPAAEVAAWLAELARVAGAGFVPGWLEANAQGVVDMGAVPGLLPGRMPVGDAGAARFAQAWGVDLPRAPGRSVAGGLAAAASGDLKAAYVVGVNPARGLPAARHAADALGRLECLVVQDLFLTETARLAHVVLPAAAAIEKEGTFTNLEGRVQLLRPVVAPPAQARPDWRIVLDLAAACGHPAPFASPAEVMEAVSSLVPEYSGAGHVRIASAGPVFVRFAVRRGAGRPAAPAAAPAVGER
ncbi:MAG: molybdopterin-dependent oxidoreductase, partial [Myxococcota bacterium]|nr:molybdopterin-dependent oxidoreductase [Myxococcota bacterium]